MPIRKDEFRSLDTDERTVPDLAPDTTQGTVYRFLLEHADQAFRQREIVAAVDVPEGSVGPTLQRLEQRGLVDHRDHFWAVSDAEHAVVSAGLHGAVTADERDGGFSEGEIESWMETAVDPIDEAPDNDDRANN